MESDAAFQSFLEWKPLQVTAKRHSQFGGGINARLEPRLKTGTPIGFVSPFALKAVPDAAEECRRSAVADHPVGSSESFDPIEAKIRGGFEVRGEPNASVPEGPPVS